MAARIWKIETGECLQILPGHTQRFTGLIFLHGNRFITGSCSKSVQMWQLETGARLFTFEVEESEAGVEAIACSPDGRLLATSYQDRSLRVWDIGSQKCLYALNDQPPWICQLLFSPDSKYLTSYSDVIMVRDVETGADVWTFKGFMEPMCLVAYSPDGQQLACSMADSLIKVLDAATGEVILTLRGHSQSVYRIVYSSDGLQIATGSQDRTIASGGWDETVRLWDTGASTMVESRRQRQSHFYPTETFFLPSESPYVISRCQEWLKLWERESGQFVRSLRIEGLHMSVLAVSPSGLEVATAGNGETIQLWNVELGKAGLALDSGTHNLFRRSVVYSPNGILLASTGGMGGRSVKVWNCRTGALVNEWTGSCEVMSLTFSKTGGQLAVCNEDFTVKLLDMFTGLCVSTLTTMGAQGPPTSHAFAAMYSSDQTEIVATFNDGTAHTWDLISGKLLRKVDAGRIVNAGYPNPYLFSPGGRLFFVFSGVLNSTSEGILQIWDTVKGELVWTIGDDETHSIRTTQALSSDQKWLVSTGSDDVIHLWDMETGQEVAKTEKLAYSCYSLAVEGTIAPAGTGKVVPGGRDTGLSLVIGLWNGSIIYWKLMEQDSVTSTGAPPSVEGVVVETQESTAKHNKGGDKAVEGVKKADYKFLMQWTSDFGKLNAQGAKIDGAQKLNRANTLLLKQNGAVGEVAPTVGFRHAVTKVMSSKNFLARLGTKQEENKEKETKVDPVRVGAIVVKENGEVVGGGCVNGEDPESSAMVARIEDDPLSNIQMAFTTDHNKDTKQEFNELDDVVETSSSNSISIVNSKEEDVSFATASESAVPALIHVSHKPPPGQFVLVMIALALCILLASLDQIIVSTAIPAISKEFNSLGEISWLGTAYMMTSTAFQSMYGKVSDIFGRKAVMLFANFMFLTGSAVAGWVTSMNMLILGRALSGIGAGGLLGMFVILSDMLDMRERGRYIGFIGAIYSLSSIIGPLLGGTFSDHVTWLWSSWINLPIGAIAMTFIAVNLNLPKPKGSFAEKTKRIDFYGSFLLFCTIITILLPLNWGGSKYPWNDSKIISLFCGGVILAIVFIVVEWKIPKEPIVPIHLFKIRDLWSTYISLFFGGMSFFGILFYLPVYFQVIKGESATIGGLETIPFICGNFLFTVGSALCIIFDKDTHRVVTFFVLLICGLGMGFTMQSMTLAVQAAVKPKYMATVTTSVQFFRSLGQVFGVAVVGSVFNNKLKDGLMTDFMGDPRIQEATQNYSDITKYYSPAPRIVIYDDFVHALGYAFYCCMGFCALAFFMSCFIHHKELKTKMNQGASVASAKPKKSVEMV
ncbi:hypothetical protein BGZ83_009421 [Gryganskiella cystojenkinii]|nr:hypothetical protein BGZ83_009421 [Gryganskiella cystojenkinii]